MFIAQNTCQVTMALLVIISKALAEIGLLLLLGQGIVALFSGNRRHENPVYKFFLMLTSPLTRLTRLITPKAVMDQHIPVVTFFLLLWLWVGMTALKVSVCQEQPNIPACARQ
jgi:uncharacterized protein YggT (Ycf19 family)